MIRIALLAIAAVLAASPAFAQDWPSKPVRFIVPFPPGGTVDPLARLLGAKLGDILKQQFIVENRPGAGGSIGTAAVMAKPESVSIGSIGNGTLGHLVLVQAQQMGGFKITHAPFGGGGPMNQNILGGQIDMGIGSVALLAPQVRGGKMRAIATTGHQRAQALPDVPTLIEQGFPGLTAYAWWGIYAPAGTPKPIVERINAELSNVLSQPDVRKTLTETLGMDLNLSTPEALQKWTLEQLAHWGKIVRDSGIKSD